MRWVGVRDGGRLVACAADTSAVAGVGHLSSIAVHPDGRGRGLGRAVTAALVRRLFDDGCDLVTLGMYADNDAGRAMYDAPRLRRRAPVHQRPAAGPQPLVADLNAFR